MHSCQRPPIAWFLFTDVLLGSMSRVTKLQSSSNVGKRIFLLFQLRKETEARFWSNRSTDAGAHYSVKSTHHWHSFLSCFRIFSTIQIKRKNCVILFETQRLIRDSDVTGGRRNLKCNVY